MEKPTQRERDILDILQEECAEVIQAISKIRRFGWEGKHPDSEQTNSEHLEEELGDLTAMINILVDTSRVNRYNIVAAELKKLDKLKKWTNICD